jgi:hypothetical protein
VHLPSTLATSGAELCAQLQDLVVRISQAALRDSNKIIQCEKRLESYAQLLKDQDRMIDELRGMNAKLVKENEALLLFRQSSGRSSAAHVRFTSDRLPMHEPEDRRRAGQLEHASPYEAEVFTSISASSTPKTKTLVQSLIDQLKEEKKNRLEVEEQSSRMIGEQQLTIHRLEERLRTLLPSPSGCAHSPRNSFTKSPRKDKGELMRWMPADSGDPPEAHELHGEWLRYDLVEKDAASQACSGDQREDKEPQHVENFLQAPRGHPEAALSVPKNLDTANDEPSIESAAALLQRIRQRHGL